jgi:hypothetical protein
VLACARGNRGGSGGDIGVATPMENPGVCRGWKPLRGFSVEAELGVEEVSSQLVKLGCGM